MVTSNDYTSVYVTSSCSCFTKSHQTQNQNVRCAATPGCSCSPCRGAGSCSARLARHALRISGVLNKMETPFLSVAEAMALNSESTRKRGRPLKEGAAAQPSPENQSVPLGQASIPVPELKVPNFAKAKAKPKAKVKVMKYCYICEEDTDDWGTNIECRPCNNDKESAVTDAKTTKID